MKEIRVNLYTSMFLTLIGAIILVLPINNIDNTNWIFCAVMLAYAIVGIIKLIIIKNKKPFILGLCSLVIGGVLLILDLTKEPLTLSFSLLAWITISSFIKLFKTDEFHDKNDRRWIISLINLAIFITIGLLCSINLYYTPEVQVLVLGFFFFIAGTLDLLSHGIALTMKAK